jgi:2OG-Fe(II) oxygenase superfamily
MRTSPLISTDIALERFDEPFVVHLAQGVVDEADVATLYRSAPLRKAEQIARTDPRYEKQYRMNLLYLVRDGERAEVITTLEPQWGELVDELLGDEFMTWLESGTGMALRELPLDIGIYTHVDGDFISVHKDKPNKAITAILYLNSDWPAGAGGEYEVRTSADPGVEPVRRIAPRPGQFLAFPPTDTSWHSVSRVDTGGTVTRLTVQLEFWFEDLAVREGT